MRRWLLFIGIVAAGVLVATVLMATPQMARADGGPHGGYSTVTDACAGCHRAHSALGVKLLTRPTQTGLCLTCHGTGGTGSNLNVDDGVFLAGRGGDDTKGISGTGLLGGGFINNTQVDPDLDGTRTNMPVTSRHSVEGTSDYSGTATLWGAGAITTTVNPGSVFDLQCASCHDAHGSPNYRLIKQQVNGVAVTVSRTDEITKSYTTPTYWVAGRQWEISSFCGACHTRYLATAGASGETDSGDAIFKYRHRIDAPSGSVLNGVTYTFPTGGALKLPVSSTSGSPSENPDNRSMACLTCHVAHGTGATMGTLSGAVPWPGGATTPSGNQRSSLLRLNNRGVCQNCHVKGGP